MTRLNELDKTTGIFHIRTLLLVNGNGVCWLADDTTSFVEGRRKEIVVPEVFLKSFRSTFPPYGGGPVVYCEECDVEFDITEGEVTRIHSIVARRDDLEVSWKADA